MRFLPDQGLPNLTPVPVYASPVSLPEDWGPALNLRAGFESSSFTVVVRLNTLRSMKVSSARHTIELDLVESIYPQGSAMNQVVYGRQQFTGFVLADIAILGETFATPYNRILARNLAADVRRDSINNDTLFSKVLTNIDEYLFATEAAPKSIPDHPRGEKLVALQFRDLRWWWRNYSTSWTGYNGCLGTVTRVPSGSTNLVEETPDFDPSYEAGRIDNPPETYTGQHDRTVFANLSQAQKDAINTTRSNARRWGGILASTVQYNARPLEEQRPLTDEGARPLSWRETLLAMLTDMGAAWKQTPEGLDSLWYTLIDPTGFRCPAHPAGPPPIDPDGGNVWTQFVKLLHGTGHTLEPNANGTFTIVETVIDDATRAAGTDASRNTLDALMAYSTRTEENAPSHYSVLPQLPTTPLPDAVKVSYQPLDSEWQWRRLGRNLISRGDRLPHAFLSTEWLLQRIHKSPYPLPLLHIAGKALSTDFASSDLVNAAVPKLTKTHNRSVLDLFAPLSPQQVYLDPAKGDDLSKPSVLLSDGNTPLTYSWGPYRAGADVDPEDAVPVRYSHPSAVETSYDQPSWLIYPKAATPQNLPTIPVTTYLPQAAPAESLYPLVKYAQQQLIGKLLDRHTVTFPRHVAILPDRYVRSISYVYGSQERKTVVQIGLASLPESAWPRPRTVEPPSALLLQTADGIAKNLTKRQTVKAVFPAQTQDTTDGWVSIESVVGLQTGAPNIWPGVRPPRQQTPEPTSQPPVENSQPYWRVEDATLVIENASGRAIRPQELFVAHRGPTGNYVVLPSSATSLAMVRAENSFSSTNASYQGRIVWDYRSTRIHALRPEDTLYEDGELVTVVNATQRDGDVGDYALVALAGQIEPWPSIDDLYAETIDDDPTAVLERPLGEVALSSTEVWMELSVSSASNVRAGLVSTASPATWDNDCDALQQGSLTAWPFLRPIDFPPHDPAIGYSAKDRVYLTADPHNPEVEYPKDSRVLVGGNVWRAKALLTPRDFDEDNWDDLGEEGLYCCLSTIGAKLFDPADWKSLVGYQDLIDRNGSTVTINNRFTDNDIEPGCLVKWIGQEIVVLTCKPIAGFE